MSENVSFDTRVLMDKQIQLTFLLLILIQGLHSIEEYFGRLWEVFTPASFLISLISVNLKTGFLILNIGFFIFGIWCWVFPIRRNHLFARKLIWFWLVIETINGIGHPIWALYERAYVPGLITALILLILVIYLSRYLLQLNPKILDK